MIYPVTDPALVVELKVHRDHPPLRLLRKTDRNDPGSTCADCGADHSEESSNIYHRAGCPSEWRNVR